MTDRTKYVEPRGVDATTVECPTCRAFDGFACGDSHCDGYHRTRILSAALAGGQIVRRERLAHGKAFFLDLREGRYYDQLPGYRSLYLAREPGVGRGGAGVTWRTGRKLARTLYKDDILIGMVDDAHVAEQIVEAMNHRQHCAERALEPFDGKPRVRPHTIKGWWQVWSGGLCIALLTDEDVAPLRNPEDTNPVPARLDADRTSTPKTRIVAHVPAGKTIGLHEVERFELRDNEEEKKP